MYRSTARRPGPAVRQRFCTLADRARDRATAVRTSEGFELTSQPLPLRAPRRVGITSLVRLLSRKEFFVRDRRASLGLIWAVGLPIVQAVVLAIVFSRIVEMKASSRTVATWQSLAHTSRRASP
jgi:hypothetical protein